MIAANDNCAPANAGAQIAALYVETNGAYYGLPGVDPWDEVRDARLYSGPHPVVAHPPCQRWGKFWAGQPLHIKRTGERKVKGDDGGCFAAALESVRKWGGVIEHPWRSHAWPHFGLNMPPRTGGWIAADFTGGWTCCVEQGRYGHYARKPTMLYAVGVTLPELEWGESEARLDPKGRGAHGAEARQTSMRSWLTRRRAEQYGAHTHTSPVPRSTHIHGALCRAHSRQRQHQSGHQPCSIRIRELIDALYQSASNRLVQHGYSAMPEYYSGNVRIVDCSHAESKTGLHVNLKISPTHFDFPLAFNVTLTKNPDDLTAHNRTFSDIQDVTGLVEINDDSDLVGKTFYSEVMVIH